MGWAEAGLSLTLVGDRAMARLNRETFGRRGPTNVIAFPLEEARNLTLRPPGVASARTRSAPPLLLGEVVISLETTRRQAQENGWPWEELFDFFLIHGILHLLGHEHDTPEAEAAMTARTWEVLKRIRGEEAGAGMVPALSP